MIVKDSKNKENSVECDGCAHRTDPYPQSDFTYMISDIRELGWEVAPDGETGQWSHKCPSCKRKDRIESQRDLLFNS